MQKFFTITLGVASCLWLLVAGTVPTIAVVKDQSRIGSPIIGQKSPRVPGSLLPDLPAEIEPPGAGKKPSGNPYELPKDEEYSNPSEPYDINDIPTLIQLDLTIDVAKRAIDAFADIGSRYDDKGLYDYPSLEEFVAKTQPGKQLETDVKKYGFKDVVEWNTAIMNVSFAFGSLQLDQEADIRGQIQIVRADKTLSPAKKQHIVASLTALIPTKENIEIIRKLQNLPTYEQKLNLLNVFE